MTPTEAAATFLPGTAVGRPEIRVMIRGSIVVLVVIWYSMIRMKIMKKKVKAIWAFYTVFARGGMSQERKARFFGISTPIGTESERIRSFLGS